MASLYDLRTRYSYEDALNLYEIVLVNQENERRAQEQAKRESTKNGHR